MTKRFSLAASTFSRISLGVCALAVAALVACSNPPKGPEVITYSPGDTGGLSGPDEADLASTVGAYTSHTNRSSGSDTHPEIHSSFTGTWLYFATDRDGAGYNLARKRIVEGQTIETVTSMKGDELWPRVSPSGRYMAFGSNSQGNWDICVMDLYNRDRAPIRITHSSSHDIHPTWSPDGQRIVYASESSTESRFVLNYVDLELPGEGGLGDNGETASLNTPLMTIGSGGFAELPGSTKGTDAEDKHASGMIKIKGRGQLLTAEGSQVTGLHPDFRPGNENRRQLVYQDHPANGERWNTLKTLDLKTGVVRLIPVSEGYGAIQPRWAPSGEQIVFATVAKREGDAMKKIFPVGAEGFAVTSPDGQTVRDLKNPTLNHMVTSPAWARGTEGESRLYFSAMTSDGKAEYIASVRLSD